DGLEDLEDLGEADKVYRHLAEHRKGVVAQRGAPLVGVNLAAPTALVRSHVGDGAVLECRDFRLACSLSLLCCPARFDRVLPLADHLAAVVCKLTGFSQTDLGQGPEPAFALAAGGAPAVYPTLGETAVQPARHLQIQAIPV